MPETTYIKAITTTLAAAMRADERVFVLGEDVAEGGPYTATAGLAEEFGTERVRRLTREEIVARVGELAQITQFADAPVWPVAAGREPRP